MHGLKFSLLIALPLASMGLLVSCDDGGDATTRTTTAIAQKAQGSSFDEAPAPQIKSALPAETDESPAVGISESPPATHGSGKDTTATLDDLLDVDNDGPTASDDLSPELIEALENPQARTDRASPDDLNVKAETLETKQGKEEPSDPPGKVDPDKIKLDETKEYPPLAWKILSGYTYVPDGLTIKARPEHEIKQGPDGQAPQGDAQLQDALKNGEDLKTFNKVPQRILDLSDRKVEIRGYMLPIDFAQDGTNEFALMELLPDCYYCSQPMPNQFVEVKMKNKKRVEYIWDRPVIVRGVIEVEPIFEEGFFINLYRLEGVEVQPVED